MIRIELLDSSPCSAYLVHNGSEGYLVDCPRIEKLDGFLESHDIELKGIVLTHCHADHMTNIHEIKNKYHIPVIAHNDDSHLALSLPLQYQFIYGSNGPEMSIKPVKIDQCIDDKDVLTLGGERIEVIHGPGHSPGCIMLYIPSIKSLMSGDVIFEHSVGRIDFPASNEQDFLNTINQRVLPLDDDTKVYSGHDVPFDGYFILKDWKRLWSNDMRHWFEH